MSSSTIRQTINTLNSINSDLSKVSPMLLAMDNRVTEVNNIFSQVHRVAALVDDCVKALSALKTCTEVLTTVPVVGSFMSTLSKVITEVKGTVNEFKVTLDGVDSSLNDVRTISPTVKSDVEKIETLNNTLQIYIPKIVNTLNVFDYTIQVADAIAPIVKGDELCGIIVELKKEISKIECAIEKPVDDINKIFEKLSNALSKAEEQCETLISKTKSIQSIVDGLSKVGKIINPISNGVNSVINAIAPVRWVLKAASCLIDKIFTPVINYILRVTGIESLINKFKDKILEKIGIKTFVDDLEAVITKDLESELSSLIQSDKIKNGVASLTSGLGDFSPANNTNLKEAFQKMIAQVINSKFDPDQPYIIPDWPVSKTQYLSLPEDSLLKVKRANRIDWSDIWQYDISTDLFSIDVHSSKTYSRLKDCHQGANFAYLISQQTDIFIQNMLDVYKVRATIEANLSKLAESVTLPLYFANEVDDIKSYIVFVDKSIQFILNSVTLSDSLKGKLTSLDNFISDQESVCDNLKTNIKSLQLEVVTFEKSALSIFNNMPSKDMILKLVSQAKEYSYQEHKLFCCFDLADDHSFSDANKDTINAVKSRVIANTEKLIADLQNLVNSSEQLSLLVNQLSDTLKKNIDSYASLSPKGYILPETCVDVMNKSASTLQQLEGVYDPLRLLIDALKTKTVGPANDDGQNTNHTAGTYLHSFVDIYEIYKCNVINSVSNILTEFSPITIIDNNVCKFTDQLKQFDTKQFDDIINTTDLIDKFIINVSIESGSVNKFISAEDAEELQKISINLIKH